MGELAAYLVQESKHFVELQVELTKMQVLQGIVGGLYDAVKIALAMALLGMGGVAVVIALALGLSVWMGSYWQGVLLTGGLLLLVGGIVLWLAIGTSFLLNVLPTDLLKQVRTLSRGPVKNRRRGTGDRRSKSRHGERS